MADTQGCILDRRSRPRVPSSLVPNKFSPSMIILVLCNIFQHHFRNVRLLFNEGLIKFVIKSREIKKFSNALEQELGIWRGKSENWGVAIQFFFYFRKSRPWGLALSQVVHGVPAALKGVLHLSFFGFCKVYSNCSGVDFWKRRWCYFTEIHHVLL